LNANSGYWLKSEYNTIDIAPGESPMLILAVSTLDDDLRLVTPDDHRESGDDYEQPTGLSYEAEETKIHVTLVGGWYAEHVFEFTFCVRPKPKFVVEQLL
ncbi:MAG TPA: hypothetical protein VN605_15250, partial [Thermoanaerobaculia bacterium]|nr:hypothetical protein [Thermoanaerobaculia bacterium]